MDVRPYQEGDQAAWLALSNTIYRPITMEQFLAAEQRWQAQDFRQRLVVKQDGQMVAAGSLAFFAFAPQGYLTVNVMVHPDWRSQGIGSRLLALIEETAIQRGHTGLTAAVRDIHPESRDWAEKRGYGFHVHRFASVLDLEAFDPKTHRSVLEQVASNGVTFSDMTGRSEEDWVRLFDFFADRLDETPDMQGIPRWTRERVRHQLFDNSNARPEWTVLAQRGGEWLGLTVLLKLGDESYSFLTGVAPPYRGLGIARALKLEIIARAVAAGFTRMRTNNLSTNLPMLAVNQALGFVPQPGHWELRKAIR